MKRIIARSTINKLNARARHYARKGERPFIAIQSAAAEIGLTEVRRDGETILYRNKQHAYVNCWTIGPHSMDIEDGGAGFDDQIDWAFIEREDDIPSEYADFYE